MQAASTGLDATALEAMAVHHGPVMKQTEDCKKWQKRYLLAYDSRLLYFGSRGEHADKARDVMNLKRASEVSACDGLAVKCEYGFKVCMPGRTFVFAVPTEEERTRWLEALASCRVEKVEEEEGDYEWRGEKIEMPKLVMGDDGSSHIWVDEYDDFPEGIQAIFKKSRVSAEEVTEHIHVVISIIRFLYKKRNFKTHTPNPYKDEEDASASRQELQSLVPTPNQEDSGAASEASGEDSNSGKKTDEEPQQPKVPHQGSAASVVAQRSSRAGSVARGSRAYGRSPLSEAELALFSEAESMYEEITPKTRKKQFKVTKELGKGGFGIVHLGTWINGPSPKESLAIKVMPHESTRSIRANLREIYWLKKLSHPNVVKIFGSVLCLTEMWVILEYMEGGTLTEAVSMTKMFREPEVAYVAREMFTGIAYMHENGVIHRDLKSANVMMTVKAEIKLIDFGLAGDVRGDQKSLKGMVGSPYWMPPEMIRGQSHSFAADSWSAGICLMELCNGHPPKMGNAFKAMFLIGSGKVPPLKKPEAWSSHLIDFFSRMLCIEQAERAMPPELLEHAFCKEKVATRADMRKKLTEIFQAGAIVSAGFG